MNCGVLEWRVSVKITGSVLSNEMDTSHVGFFIFKLIKKIKNIVIFPNHISKVFVGYMWAMHTALDTTGLQHIHYHRKSCWAVLNINQIVKGKASEAQALNGTSLWSHNYVFKEVRKGAKEIKEALKKPSSFWTCLSRFY